MATITPLNSSSIYDEKIVRELFEQHYTPLVLFAKGYIPDLDTDKDVVQEVFLSLIESQETFNDVDNLKAYLYGTVRHKCLKYLRHEEVKRRYQKYMQSEAPDETRTYEGIWYNRTKVIMPHNAAGRRLCVYITAVRLYCFRSYTELRFEPAKGLNVIVGANAAGKTNILESVFLAALGRSHRTRRDAELINSLSDKAYAGIELVSATGKHSIELKLFSGAPKQVFIDGQRIRRMGELMGVLNAVMFSPEDLSLVKDSPETRRRFMDMELCQLRPAYFYRLQQYNAALKQRTALLKTSFPFEPNIELLDMWDDKLAELGGSVMLLRRDFLDRLSTAARDLNRSITGNSSVGHEPEELFTYYKPSVPFEGDGARAALGDALCKARAEDIRRGCTTKGPHRDDIGILLNGRDVRVFGSQGQQRTAALSLKLSELALMRRVRGEAPVLLLDDVLSELDGDRQRELLSSAFDCQCFLTSTTLDGLEQVPNMTVFECSGGKLKKILSAEN